MLLRWLHRSHRCRRRRYKLRQTIDTSTSNKKGNQNGKNRKLSDSSNSTVIETVKLTATTITTNETSSASSLPASPAASPLASPPSSPPSSSLQPALTAENVSVLHQDASLSLKDASICENSQSSKSSQKKSISGSQPNNSVRDEILLPKYPEDTENGVDDERVVEEVKIAAAAIVAATADEPVLSPTAIADEEEEATINDVDDDEHQLQDDLIEDCLSNGGGRKSCMSSRRSSSKSSIKKRVNYSESQEIIPPPPLCLTDDAFENSSGNVFGYETEDCAPTAGNGARDTTKTYWDASDMHPSVFSLHPNQHRRNGSQDDDEVFSDSVPAKFLRGDMCTPYPKKRSSIPGVFALPDWFGDDR